MSPTSVDLRYLRAIGLAERVILARETASEADTLGFDVLRSRGGEGRRRPVHGRARAGRGARWLAGVLVALVSRGD